MLFTFWCCSSIFVETICIEIELHISNFFRKKVSKECLLIAGVLQQPQLNRYKQEI